MMKKSAIAAALAAGLLASSCLGPNNAYNSIRNWNARAIKPDWLSEIVFLGFNIIPVYQISLLGDYLIFNTVDYWTGNNPISDPGEFPADEFGK